MNPNASKAMQQYAQVGTRTGIEDATPHRLVQMLMEGALDRIAAAKGHMSRGETARKGEYIGLAISIIDGLRAALDREAGGEIAQNLEGLYDYMCRRLLEANLNNDVGILDEVGRLMGAIKTAWDAIADKPEAAVRQVSAVAGEVAGR